MTKRLGYIDRMKGFAILLMVLGHVYLFALNEHGGLVNRFIGSCHMFIFMFMSGYVAYIGDLSTLKRKLVKRIPTYILPAFVICWAAFPISVWMGKCQWNSFIYSSLTGGYWYLKCLAIFCLLQYPILICKKLHYELIFVAIIYAVFITLWKVFPQIATEQYIPLEHCSCFYPSFILGYYFRKYDLMHKLAVSNWVFSIALIGYIYLYFADIQDHLWGNISNRYVRPTLAILFITYIFLRLEDKSNKFLSWLEFFGRNSLDVYLFNGIFLMTYSIVDLSSVRVWTYTNNMPLLTLLIAMLASIVIAYICVGIGKLLHESDLLERWLYGKFV